jgi:hypothetical protein
MSSTVTNRVLLVQHARLLPVPPAVEHVWQQLLQRRPFAMLCFALGLTVIGWLSQTMWTDHWSRVAISFKVVEVQAAEQPYGCSTSDCAACLTQIDAYRHGLVFTGGSGGAYGFDLSTLARISNRPVANCIIYGTTLDGFQLILNRRNKLSPQQVLLHGLNSWVMIDGGHYVSRLDDPNADFVYFRNPRAVEPPTSSLKLHLYPILLQRHFAELQVRWRAGIRRDWPLLAPWIADLPFNVDRDLVRERLRSLATMVALWPLNMRTHLAYKDRLMQRWIKLSPWAASFLQQVDIVPSEEALRRRLGRIRQHFPPPTRMILFNMPEYTPITEAQRAPIYAESKQRFLAVLKTLGIDYIDVDYEGCGLTRDDFWKPGSFVLDPVHPHEEAKGRITDCLLKELKQRDVFQ